MPSATVPSTLLAWRPASYNWIMGSKLSSNVADLSDGERQLLESWIGQQLRRDQVLYWLVASPGRKPTNADKAQSRSGLEGIFKKVDRHVADQGISPEEFASAVDEAVRHVRSSPNECGT